MCGKVISERFLIIHKEIEKDVFIRTEERAITREELLSKGPWHTEYLTSVVYDGEDEERGFVSGVSTIQGKWHPNELCVDTEAADVAGSIMAEVNKLVDDPNDLAVIQKIIEKAIAHCETESREAEVEFGEDMGSVEEDHFSKQHMVDQIRKRLMKLYRQEYCRLVWNGSICSEVRVVPEPVMDEHGYIDICSKAYTSVVLCFTPISELKKQAESDFFSGYENRTWQGVNAVFQLKMLAFPETLTIARLREYFGAISKLLRTKTVFESDMRENPTHVMGEMVYYPDEINARLGTGLVEEVQSFGWALKNNRCFEALCAFERV